MYRWLYLKTFISYSHVFKNDKVTEKRDFSFTITSDDQCTYVILIKHATYIWTGYIILPKTVKKKTPLEFQNSNGFWLIL